MITEMIAEWDEESHKRQLADYQRTERNDQMREKKKGKILVTLRKREKDYSTFPLPHELPEDVKNG